MEGEDKWTKRGDGVFTDDETDTPAEVKDDGEVQDDSPRVAPSGGFGHRLARFARPFAKVAETEKESGPDELPEGNIERPNAVSKLLRGATSKTGSESSGSSVFPESPASKEPPLQQKPSQATARSGSRRAFRKPRRVLDGSTGMSDSDTVFPPPPAGFGECDGRRARRTSRTYLPPHPQRRPSSGGPHEFDRRANEAPPTTQHTQVQQSPIIIGLPLSNPGSANHIVPIKIVYMLGSVISDGIGVSADGTLNAGSSATTSLTDLERLLSNYRFTNACDLKGIRSESAVSQAAVSQSYKTRPPRNGFRGSSGRAGRANFQRRPHLRPSTFVPRRSYNRAAPASYLRKTPAALQYPTSRGFPLSRKGPSSRSVPVKHLTVTGIVGSDTVKVSADINTRNSATATYDNLPRILGNYYVADQLQLKNILFDTSVAEAFGQVDASAWNDCELVVHNCDFRGLSVDAFETLLEQMAPTRLHIKGTLELPEECADLLDLAAVQATTVLKFSGSGQTAPSVKIDAEKLCKWLHSGSDQPRYVALQNSQVNPDLHTLLKAFRSKSRVSRAQSHFILDIFTKEVPAQISGGHVLQEVEYDSMQRLNVRYDIHCDRVILKRYHSQLKSARKFEHRVRVGAGDPFRKHQSGALLTNDVAEFEQGGDSLPDGASVESPEDGRERCDSANGSAALHDSDTSSATNEDDDKQAFMAVVAEHFSRVYDLCMEKGQSDEAAAFRERLVDMINEFAEEATSD